MAQDQIDKSAFWNSMILPWEAKRYGEERGWVGRLFSSSVMARRRHAMTLLAPRAKDRVVLELGCGSGQLAEELLALGASRYVGVDFSRVAIERAKLAAVRRGFASKTDFSVASVGELPPMEFDVCFSLGLLDWLSDREVEAMVRATTGRECLHSFSEARPGDLLRQVHSKYVHLKYGHRQRYVPRYHTEDEIRKFLGSDVRFHRDRAMRFGTLAHRFGERQASKHD
ncbi:MAG: class I SAM-dependent methyltransferase [Bdellovibrionota bacterium]